MGYQLVDMLNTCIYNAVKRKSCMPLNIYVNRK